MILMALTCIVALDLSPSSMGALRTERASAIDKLVLHVELLAGNAPSGEALNPASWRTGPVQFHRITIASPTVFDEMTDGRNGPVLVSHTIRDGTIVRRFRQQEPDGATRYGITSQPRWSDYHTAAGHALLQFLDVHLGDSPEAWTSITGLLESGRADFVATLDDGATYSASVSNANLRHKYEFALNARGTPQFVKTLYEYVRDGKIIGTAVYEQHVLEAVSIGDYELPIRTVFISKNPALEGVPGMSDRVGVVEVRITDWCVDPSLHPDQVGERAERKSSIIIETDEHGDITRTKYDNSGRIVAVDTRDPKNDKYARVDSLAWRRQILLPGLTAIAMLAACAFFAFTRRGA